MGVLDAQIYFAAFVLGAVVVLFAWLLRRIDSSANRKFGKDERRLNDVAVYLSHLSDDFLHLQMVAEKKLAVKDMEGRLGAVIDKFKHPGKEEKQKVFVRGVGYGRSKSS